MRPPVLQHLARHLSTLRAGSPLELSATIIPEGFPSGPARRFAAQPTPTLLPRACDAALDALLPPAAPAPTPRPIVVLDGPRGVGKSAALLSAVARARAAGAVVAYMPSARAWTHGRGFFSAVPVAGKDLIKDGAAAVRWYERPWQTLALLSALLDAHGEALARMECALASPTREEAGAGTVRELVEYGVGALRDVDADWRVHPRRGGDALDSVVRELCAQESVPFMLAIDDYGSFLGMADLVSGARRCLHAGGIRAVAELFGRDALPGLAASIRNGSVIVALDQSHGATTWRPARVDGTVDFPVTEGVRRDSSGKQWLANVRAMADRLAEGEAVEDLLDEDNLLDPTAVSAAAFAQQAQYFDVPEWTSEEALQVVAGFEREERLAGLEDFERRKLFELAGGRADLLHKLCMAH
jgi:Mitochondrial ribosomal death-associated protein 3